MDDKPIEKPQDLSVIEDKDYTYKSSYRFQAIPPCTITLDDLKKLYEILKTAATEGSEIEIAKLKKTPGQTDTDFDNLKRYARTLFKVTIQIYGSKGDYIFTESPSMFNESSLPDTVTKIVFDNTQRFKAMLQQKEPTNKFHIEFDFTKQRIFDLTTMPSEPTPNKSFLNIQGENDTWVSGTYNKIIEFLQERGNKHGLFHKRNVYDLFLFFFIIPLSLRLLFNVNKSLPLHFAELSAFFKVACYLYFSFSILMVYRLVFNYTRWIFPYVDLVISPRKGAIVHRMVLGVILLGFLTTFLWDTVILNLLKFILR